jgi:hypothetical protein
MIVTAVAIETAAPQERITVDQLVDRATAYVETLVKQLSRVVAEERYVQEYLDSGVEGSRGSFVGAPKVRERRVLLSDLLLVKPPESSQWLMFRDVFDVDGRAVRNRESRLTRLFLESPDTITASERARQIADESARFNIRPIGTVDNPFLAIGFLQQAYRQRFRFTLGRRDASLGPNVWIVEYRETARPTITRGSGDTDVFARGRYLIDADGGKIVRADVTFVSLGAESSIATRFDRDDRLDVLLPAVMTFRRSVVASEVRGVATYSRFRRFEVGTEESIVKSP